jgi:hypothetical protein
MFERLSALKHFLLSFRTREWNVHHYPLKITAHPATADEASSQAEVYRWTVEIINWGHMHGEADTREEAIWNLQLKLEEHLRQHDSLPRPGTGRPPDVEPATSRQVNAHDEIVADLLQRVFAIDPATCVITDRCTLDDLHYQGDSSRYVREILQLYEVDVSDLDPPYLVAIAERIRERRTNM